MFKHVLLTCEFSPELIKSVLFAGTVNGRSLAALDPRSVCFARMSADAYNMEVALVSHGRFCIGTLGQ